MSTIVRGDEHAVVRARTGTRPGSERSGRKHGQEPQGVRSVSEGRQGTLRAVCLRVREIPGTEHRSVVVQGWR